MRLFTDPWAHLRGRHHGETAFILGNGPSICREDLSRLRGRLSIGMNASTQLETAHGFVQTYYTVSDRRFLTHPDKRRWATSDLDPGTVRVLRADLRPDDEPGPNRTLYTPHIRRDGWSRDLGIGFHYGCTTTMLAVQLAAHLGCRRICLLGVDLRYAPESPRFYAEVDPQVEDAFTSVQIWNLSNAGRVLRAEGRELINCSEASLLRPYLPFMRFSELADLPAPADPAMETGMRDTATACCAG